MLPLPSCFVIGLQEWNVVNRSTRLILARAKKIIQGHGQLFRSHTRAWKSYEGARAKTIWCILVLPSGRRHRHTTRVLYLAPAVRRHRVHASGSRDLVAFLASTHVGSLVGPRIGSSPKSKFRRGSRGVGILLFHLTFCSTSFFSNW